MATLISEYENNIKLYDYTEKSVLLLCSSDWGRTHNVYLKELGKFGPGFTVDGEKRSGWIFSKKKTPELTKYVEENNNVIEERKEPTLLKETENYQLYDYTEKSLLLVGAEETDERLKELGKYGKNFMVNREKTEGWIFSKKKEQELLEIIN